MLEIKKILFPCGLAENLPKILTYVLSIAEKYNGEGFLYVPVEWEMYKKYPLLQDVHSLLYSFYYPINDFDRSILGGPTAGHVPLFAIE